MDILAEEENLGRKIVIENQLEMTDHSHLGQILTYASGYDAEIVIWIVKGVRDEHKQAIDWLNEHTDEKLNFFAITMELWQIGDSPYVPKFQIISKPNDWAKAIKSSHSQWNLTDMKMLQLDFWNNFREHTIQSGLQIGNRKAEPRHWYDISIGRSDTHISLTINTRENEIGCELYIKDSKELYSLLESNKQKIEDDLGFTLEWMKLENKKASRIKISSSANINQSEKWNNYFDWLNSKISSFQKVFWKVLKNKN